MDTSGVRWTSRGPAPTVSIQLLGTFSLTVDGEEVSLPTGAQRLVGILALRGRLGRSRLAGMLWPDATEQRALASLRTGIWRINQAGPGLVESDHGTVRLGLAPSVDLHDLIAWSCSVLDDAGSALGSGLPPGAAPYPWWSPADTASAGVLPDWDDPWIDQERERLRQLRLHVMDAQARWLCRTGRFGLALDLALAALRTDELRESAHRLVIEIHLAEANRAEARRVFQRCRAVLGAELGIEPSDELRDLVASAAASF